MDFQWRNITFSKLQSQPKARWGHSGCQLNDPNIFLFGGYSQSKYYNDSWIFNWATMTWREIITNTTPSARSNSSVVFDKKSNKVYLFGGGSSSNKRRNDIWALNLHKPQNWQLISKPGTDGESLSFSFPWPRTYHTCCLYRNHLIIYGGQGFGNDLEDLWAYDLSLSLWKQLKCNKIPHGRRFHSSALIDNFYYIIGGCHDGYHCLNDIHRINLDQFLNFSGNINNTILQQQLPLVDWQQIKLSENNIFTPRWGHNSCAIDGNIYIFGGRSSIDHNDLIVISGQTPNYTIKENPENNRIQQKSTDSQNMKISKLRALLPPKGRRKPCMWNIGNCILIHGGFNGTYCQDLTFINVNKSFQLNFDPLTLHKINEPQKRFQNCLKQMKKKYKSNTLPHFSLNLKLSNEHQEYQRKRANEFEEYWKSFDLHVNTKDKKTIHLRKTQIRNAFTTEDAMIHFLQKLAEEPYQTACKYTRAIQYGVIPIEFTNNDRQYLFKYDVIIKDNLLGTMQRRMIANIVQQQTFMFGNNPLKAIKTQKSQVHRIYSQIINHPSNNLSLQIALKHKKETIFINKYMIGQRSQYFASIVCSNLKYSDQKIQLMTNILNKKLINESHIEVEFNRNLQIYKILIIYLHHGHMVLPKSIKFDDLLECYVLAEMYLIQGARQIILNQIFQMIALNNQVNAEQNVLKEDINRTFESNEKQNFLLRFIKFSLQGDDRANLDKLIELVIGNILLDASKLISNKKQTKSSGCFELFSLNNILKSQQKQSNINNQNKQNVNPCKRNPKYSKEIDYYANKQFINTLLQIKSMIQVVACSAKDKQKIRDIVSGVENAYKLELSYWQKNHPIQ